MKTTHRILLFAALLMAGCEKSETARESVPPAGPSVALAAVFKAGPEGGAQAIHVVRGTAKPGEAITVSGRVMGRKHPFVEGRAAFLLGDPEVLTPCNENPDDACTTPWDACCDSPEDKQRGTATIQVVDDGGRVLKESIEGVGGLGNLSTLVVSGTVAEGSTPEALVINARAIRVE